MRCDYIMHPIGFRFRAAGGTRLILDVQDNHGGYEGLAQSLLEFLFPAITDAAYPMQFPDTPFVTQMVQASIKDLEKTDSFLNHPTLYHWYGYGKNASRPFRSSDGYFFPTVSLTYNGKTSQYSSLLSPVDRVGYPFGVDSLTPPKGVITPQFEKNQTMILSNGACFSECSTFSYLMQEVGVKIVSVGGSLGKPMAFSAGTARSPYDLDRLLYFTVQYFNLTEALGAPQPLLVEAHVNYMPAQVLSPQSSTIPADFVFKPADHRFTFTEASAESVEALYNQAAKYFP